MSAGRRAVMAALASIVCAAWPSMARAQKRVPRIGYLVHSPLTDPPSRERAAFRDDLSKPGYAIGKTLHVEHRCAENEPKFFTPLVADLLALEVDLIVAPGERAALAAKAATSRVPSVFAHAPDPLGSAWVTSLARSGGNATGLSFIAPGLAGKRLQLLQEVLPAARRLALSQDASLTTTNAEVQASGEAKARLGLRLEHHRLHDTAQLSRNLKQMATRRPYAPLILADLRMIACREILIDWAARKRVPTMAGWTDTVRAGGLPSYAQSDEALFRRAAHCVQQILAGAKPGDLPVEQPMKFDLVINLKTAKALGLAVPKSLLLRADEAIQ